MRKSKGEKRSLEENLKKQSIRLYIKPYKIYRVANLKCLYSYFLNIINNAFLQNAYEYHFFFKMFSFKMFIFKMLTNFNVYIFKMLILKMLNT